MPNHVGKAEPLHGREAAGLILQVWHQTIIIFDHQYMCMHYVIIKLVVENFVSGKHMQYSFKLFRLKLINRGTKRGTHYFHMHILHPVCSLL